MALTLRGRESAQSQEEVFPGGGSGRAGIRMGHACGRRGRDAPVAVTRVAHTHTRGGGFHRNAVTRGHQARVGHARNNGIIVIVHLMMTIIDHLVPEGSIVR